MTLNSLIKLPLIIYSLTNWQNGKIKKWQKMAIDNQC